MSLSQRKKGTGVDQPDDVEGGTLPTGAKRKHYEEVLEEVPERHSKHAKQPASAPMWLVWVLIAGMIISLGMSITAISVTGAMQHKSHEFRELIKAGGTPTVPEGWWVVVVHHSRRLLSQFGIITAVPPVAAVAAPDMVLGVKTDDSGGNGGESLMKFGTDTSGNRVITIGVHKDTIQGVHGTGRRLTGEICESGDCEGCTTPLICTDDSCPWWASHRTGFCCNGDDGCPERSCQAELAQCYLDAIWIHANGVSFGAPPCDPKCTYEFLGTVCLTGNMTVSDTLVANRLEVVDPDNCGITHPVCVQDANGHCGTYIDVSGGCDGGNIPFYNEDTQTFVCSPLFNGCDSGEIAIFDDGTLTCIPNYFQQLQDCEPGSAIIWTGTGVTCQQYRQCCGNCSDGIMNGNETGVDCGGPDCPCCCGTLQWQSEEYCCANNAGGEHCPCGVGLCDCGGLCGCGSFGCPCGDTGCPCNTTDCPCAFGNCGCNSELCPCATADCPCNGTDCPCATETCPCMGDNCPCGEGLCPASEGVCPCDPIIEVPVVDGCLDNMTCKCLDAVLANISLHPIEDPCGNPCPEMSGWICPPPAYWDNTVHNDHCLCPVLCANDTTSHVELLPNCTCPEWAVVVNIHNDHIYTEEELAADPSIGVCVPGASCDFYCWFDDLCSNGQQDAMFGETGPDCGGCNCDPCPNCTNGVQDGQETGVDCGGPFCPCCCGDTLIIPLIGGEPDPDPTHTTYCCSGEYVVVGVEGIDYIKTYNFSEFDPDGFVIDHCPCHVGGSVNGTFPCYCGHGCVCGLPLCNTPDAPCGSSGELFDCPCNTDECPCGFSAGCPCNNTDCGCGSGPFCCGSFTDDLTPPCPCNTTDCPCDVFGCSPGGSPECPPPPCACGEDVDCPCGSEDCPCGTASCPCNTEDCPENVGPCPCDPQVLFPTIDGCPEDSIFTCQCAETLNATLWDLELPCTDCAPATAWSCPDRSFLDKGVMQSHCYCAPVCPLSENPAPPCICPVGSIAYTNDDVLITQDMIDADPSLFECQPLSEENFEECNFYCWWEDFCHDGIQNFGETGTDCGNCHCGPCCDTSPCPGVSCPPGTTINATGGCHCTTNVSSCFRLCEDHLTISDCGCDEGSPAVTLPYQCSLCTYPTDEQAADCYYCPLNPAEIDFVGSYTLIEGSPIPLTPVQCTFTGGYGFSTADCGDGTTVSCVSIGVGTVTTVCEACVNASCLVCDNCTDGILNGYETGIDCGGPRCPPCEHCPEDLCPDIVCPIGANVNEMCICQATSMDICSGPCVAGGISSCDCGDPLDGHTGFCEPCADSSAACYYCPDENDGVPLDAVGPFPPLIGGCGYAANLATITCPEDVATYDCYPTSEDYVVCPPCVNIVGTNCLQGCYNTCQEKNCPDIDCPDGTHFSEDGSCRCALNDVGDTTTCSRPCWHGISSDCNGDTCNNTAAEGFCNTCFNTTGYDCSYCADTANATWSGTVTDYFQSWLYVCNYQVQNLTSLTCPVTGVVVPCVTIERDDGSNITDSFCTPCMDFENTDCFPGCSDCDDESLDGDEEQPDCGGTVCSTCETCPEALCPGTICPFETHLNDLCMCVIDEGEGTPNNITCPGGAVMDCFFSPSLNVYLCAACVSPDPTTCYVCGGAPEGAQLLASGIGTDYAALTCIYNGTVSATTCPYYLNGLCTSFCNATTDPDFSIFGEDCLSLCPPCLNTANPVCIIDCTDCEDGAQNGDETGLNCGGATCTPCPTCSDGITNGDELGTDCDGSCPPCIP